ncbi:MAG: hypothetical protein JW782_00240 [Candidatus Saganbacteria bacterium]|nr:hypothetical protein [Candidatus Saganbacteria bacterium]
MTYTHDVNLDAAARPAADPSSGTGPDLNYDPIINDGTEQAYYSPIFSRPFELYQILSFEQSAEVLRQLLGRGSITLDHLSALPQPELAWHILLNTGLIDEQGNIQPAFRLDRQSIVSVLQAGAPVGSSALSEQEAGQVYEALRQAYVQLTESGARSLLEKTNELLNQCSGNETLDAWTLQRIETDALLRDYLRLRLLGYHYSIAGLRPDGAVMPDARGEQAGSMIDMTRLALSRDLLPAYLMEAFQSGDFRLEVRFTQNRQGEFDSFRVVLQAGWYEEVVAEFRDNEIVRGNPPASPVARGAIAYLQRLMRGSTANRYTFDEEGVFCRDTLTALYSFMAAEELLQTNFNSETAGRILAQRINEARRAVAAYENALVGEIDIAALDAQVIARLNDRNNPAPNQDLINAYLRYQLAQEALNSIFTVIDLASRYRDIQGANLSAEDLAFIQACNEAIEGTDTEEGFRAIADRILGDIMAEDSGLLTLELRSYRYHLSEYVEARDRASRPTTRYGSTEENQEADQENQRKASEAFDEFLNQAQRVLSQLRQWQQFCQNNPAVHQAVATRIVQLINRLTSQILDEELGADFPGPERTHIQERLLAIDQEVMTDIEGNRSVDSLSIPQLRLRYYRADQLSHALNEGGIRSVTLQFIGEFLRNTRPTELTDQLRLFSRLLGQANILERMARGSYQNRVLESYGLPHVYNSDNDYNFLIYHEPSRSFYNLSSREFNRMTQLAGHLYALAEQYNAYAGSAAGRAAGLQPITFEQAVANIQAALKILQGPDGEFLADQEIIALLDIVRRSGTEPSIARLEIAEQMGTALVNHYHRDSREMRGANQLDISPRVIQTLERTYSERLALNGLVTYEDMARWGSAFLPPDAAPGDLFYVSGMGIERIDSAPANTLLVPANDLAGQTASLAPLDLMTHEAAATLKLALVRYVPVSDQQVLMLSGIVTNRLTHIDLAGINEVFGAGTDSIFNPGTFELTALESSSLRTLADIWQARSPETARLLRRLAAATQETSFSQAEVDQLAELVNELEQLDCPTLDELELSALASAREKLLAALPQMLTKPGLSAEQQSTLSELAGYLAWAERLPADSPLRAAIAINDGTLASGGDEPEPPAGLVSALREAAAQLGESFDPSAFRRTYAGAVTILRYLHRSLLIMAAKNPPEAPAWEGVGPLLLHHYLEAIPDAMTETISAPSQSDYLMTGLPNDLIIQLNALIYSVKGENNDIIDELGSVQDRLVALRQELGLALNEVDQQLASGAATELTRAIRECQAILRREPLGELRSRLRNILRSQTSGTDDPRLRENDQIRPYLNAFLSLLEQLRNYDRSPSAYLTGANDLLENILIQQQQLRTAIRAEQNRGKRELLEQLLPELELIRTRLRVLINTGSQTLPLFEEKLGLEARQREIMATLMSDRFDQAKFTALAERFPALFNEPDDLLTRTLNWVGGIFRGDQGELAIPNVTAGPVSLISILNEFFRSGQSLSLANLMIAPGESRQTLLAKIALSRILERLPREQDLDLLRTIPVMTAGWLHLTHGDFSALRDLPALYSGLHSGPADRTFGPGNAEELTAMASSPWRMLQNDFLSFLALSSNEHPAYNMSSQVIMLLSQSRRRTISEHLSTILSGTDWNSADTLPLAELDHRTMELFLEYLTEEILPQLENPNLRQRIEYLFRTNRIPLSLNDLLAFNNASMRQEFLAGLPQDSSFRIHDVYHEEAYPQAARLLETVLRVVGEINQNRALENLDIYPMAYFDPLQALQDSWLRYQLDGNTEPPTEITVASYSDRPGSGSLDEMGWLDLQQQRISNWLERYGEDALANIWDDLNNDPAGFSWDALTAGAGFSIHFGLWMRTQIELGYAGTYAGLGELLSAVENHDNQLAKQAAQNLSASLARTAGAFMTFETMPWIFYSDVINDIESGDLRSAFGKAVAISVMTWRSFRTTVDIVNLLVRRGHAVIENGYLSITDPEIAENMFERRMRPIQELYQRTIAGRLGLRLAYYHFNPFAIANRVLRGTGIRLYQAARYTFGSLQLEVRPASVQLELVQEGPRPQGPERVLAELDRYRIAGNALNWPFIRQLVNLPRRSLDLISRRKGGMPVQQDGSFSVDMLIEAATYPGRSFSLTVTKLGQSTQLNLNGRTYIELVRAVAENRYRDFRRIIERYNTTASQAFSDGSIRQLFRALKPAAEEFSIMKDSFGQIEAQQTAWDPTVMLQDATARTGLGSRYRLTLPILDPTTGQPRVVELTGRQICEILHNNLVKPSGRSVVSADVDAAVTEYFRTRVQPKHLFQMVKQIGRNQIVRFGRQLFGSNRFLRARLDPGFTRRLVRRLISFITRRPGRYGRANLTGWRQVRRALLRLPGGRALVKAYGRKLLVTDRIASRSLAEMIYDDYLSQRTDRVLGELDQAARSETGPLNDRQRAAYEREGGLRRGRIFRRLFQRVFRSAREAVRTSLAEHDTSFSVSETAEQVVARTPAAVQPGFNVEMARSTLAALGIEAEGITTREGFLSRIGQAIGDRLPAEIERLRQNSPAEYERFLRQVIKPTGGQRAAISSANFIAGIISYFGMEALIDLLGLELDKKEHLLVLVGGSHLINTSFSSALNTAIRGEAAMAIERGLARCGWIGRISRTGFGILSGLGGAMVSTRFYNRLLDLFGVSENSAWRGELAQFAAAFGGPSLAAGSVTLLSRLGILGPRLAAFLRAGGTGLGLAALFSDAASYFLSDYEQSVNSRVNDRMLDYEVDHWYNPFELLSAGTRFLTTKTILPDSTFNAAASADHPDVRDAVLRQDCQVIRDNLPPVLNFLRQLWLSYLNNYNGGPVSADFLQDPVLNPDNFRRLFTGNDSFDNVRPTLATISPLGQDNSSFLFGDLAGISSNDLPLLGNSYLDQAVRPAGNSLFDLATVLGETPGRDEELNLHLLRVYDGMDQTMIDQTFRSLGVDPASIKQVPGHPEFYLFSAPAGTHISTSIRGDEIREADAYDYVYRLFNQASIDEAALVSDLAENYNISAPETFIERVLVHQLRQQLAGLSSLRPDTVNSNLTREELGEPVYRSHQQVVSAFDQHGRLADVHDRDLLLLLAGSEQQLDQLTQLIAQLRQLTRLQALLNGAEPTAADRQVGLVNEDNTINEDSLAFSLITEEFSDQLGNLFNPDQAIK